MKRVLIIITILILLAAVAGLIYYKYNSKNSVGNGTDGGLTRFGSGRIESQEEELLKQVFAQENGYNIENVYLRADIIDGVFARGVAGLSDDVDSAWFFAERVNGEWKIIISDYGPIFCEEVSIYGFPEDMISDCYSEEEILEENFDIYL
jgi:hypothetical protein